MAQFSISDTGVGMSNKQQKEIFEPFFRTPEVKNIPGIGLGFSLVKQICIYHNLEITIESKESKGTRITISKIPCFLL